MLCIIFFLSTRYFQQELSVLSENLKFKLHTPSLIIKKLKQCRPKTEEEEKEE